MQRARLIQCHTRKKNRRRGRNGYQHPAKQREQQAKDRSSLHAQHDRHIPEMQVNQRPVLQWLDVMNDRQSKDEGSCRDGGGADQHNINSAMKMLTAAAISALSKVLF